MKNIPWRLFRKNDRNMKSGTIREMAFCNSDLAKLRSVHAMQKNKNRGLMIHVRETAPFYFGVFLSAPCDDCNPQPWSVFLNRLAFFSEATAFLLNKTVDDSLWFCCFWTPNTPKFPRRASRAGLQHFLCFCCFGP